MRATTAYAVLLLFLLVVTVKAHDKYQSPSSTPKSEQSGTTIAPIAEPATEHAVKPIDQFPTLHPLLVHFPIALLMLAAILQVFGLFVFKPEIGWIVVLLAVLGLIGSYPASNVFHPHTTGLSENAQRLLLEHELYAQLIFWFALAAVLAKGISVFLKRPWWGEVPATALLMLTALAVAIAGHHGAELVHKEGVGPQGRFLEVDTDH